MRKRRQGNARPNHTQRALKQGHHEKAYYQKWQSDTLNNPHIDVDTRAKHAPDNCESNTEDAACTAHERCHEALITHLNAHKSIHRTATRDGKERGSRQVGHAAKILHIRDRAFRNGARNHRSRQDRNEEDETQFEHTHPQLSRSVHDNEQECAANPSRDHHPHGERRLH